MTARNDKAARATLATPLDRPEAELAGQFALAVAGHASVKAIARAAVDQARRLGGVSAMIHLFHPQRRTLSLVAETGVLDTRGFRMVPLESPLLLARTARSLDVLTGTPDELKEPAQAPMRALLRATRSDFVASAPLVAHGELVGVATWTMPTRRVYGAAERAKIASLSRMIAGALAAAAMRDRARAERGRLMQVIRAAIDLVCACDSTSVLHAVAEQARAIGGAHVAAVGVHDGHPLSPALLRWAVSGAAEPVRPPKLTGALTGALLRTEPFELSAAHPVAAITRVFPDDDVRRLLAVPLLHRGQVIGTLLLGRRGESRLFTAEETEAVRLFAQYAAPAIELARNRERRPLHDAAHV